jgi:hypothetical protein
MNFSKFNQIAFAWVAVLVGAEMVIFVWGAHRAQGADRDRLRRASAGGSFACGNRVHARANRVGVGLCLWHVAAFFGQFIRPVRFKPAQQNL